MMDLLTKRDDQCGLFSDREDAAARENLRLNRNRRMQELDDILKNLPPEFARQERWPRRYV